jgi:protein MpaA
VSGHLLPGWRSEEFGRSVLGVPLRVFLPEGDGPIAGLLTASQHGEEIATGLLARRLLERIGADETRWAVVPVMNPDGVLAGTRQNANGVDLNRNFPAATWRPESSRTYPPGIADALRTSANRTNLSSPGPHGGSEPETRAQMELVERLAPGLVIDLHSPLELMLVRGTAPRAVVDALAAAAGLRVESDLDSPTPGAFDDWLTERGVPALVYEVEHAGLPALCSRHLAGLEALLRAGG